MPENPSPAAQPESGAEPAEFNFDGAGAENPRIKRRNLKTARQPAGLSPSPGNAVAGARDLEREAPPLSAETTSRPKAQEPAAAPKSVPVVVKAADAPTPPPRTKPASSTTNAGSTASKPSSSSTTSPHGTRPATLYYSSYPKKDKEASSSPMKSIPTASNSSAASSASRPASTAASATPSSAARPSVGTGASTATAHAAASATRPSATIDYRANVERQTREQRSVGSILSYVVYALIAFFVLGAALAGYGTYTLSRQIHDQSVTVSDLDQRYAAANKILTVNLTTTQDSLVQAQAQVARQQDLIIKQQEELNRLIAATNDANAAIKSEKTARAQEAAILRARVRDLETHSTSLR